MMGKLQMDREWTEQDLRTFAEGAQAAFETVLLDELPQDTGWQDEGLQVSYSLCNGRVSCVLHRTVRADGKLWRITMSAPLAGNLLPPDRHHLCGGLSGHGRRPAGAADAEHLRRNAP